MAADVPGLSQQIHHFESRLRTDPGSRAYLPLADLYRRAGQPQRARELLVAGLANDGGFMSARVALGEVLMSLGELPAARIELQTVLERDPDNLLALELLVRDAANGKDWLTARRLAERLLRLRPESAEVRGILRQARGRTSATLAATSRSSTPPPDPPPAASPPVEAAPPPASVLSIGAGFETPTLADLYRRQGHVEKARAILERILAEEPERTDALQVLARLGADAEPTPASALQANGEATDGRPDPDDQTPASAKEPATGRNGDLDRFRAWLERAGEPPDPGR